MSLEEGRLEDCGIEELYGQHKPRPAGIETLPMAVPEDMYSWQYLETLPYGLCIWDIARFNGATGVVFMVRESTADIQDLPRSPDAYWKLVSLGTTIDGRRVMPVVALINFLPLHSIYEVWFNFYGEAGKETQGAFQLLAQQSHLMLFFHDRGPEPLAKFAFPNNLAHFFRGHYGMIKAIPEWSDSDFNEAKRRLIHQYSVADLWRLE